MAVATRTSKRRPLKASLTSRVPKTGPARYSETNYATARDMVAGAQAGLGITLTPALFQQAARHMAERLEQRDPVLLRSQEIAQQLSHEHRRHEDEKAAAAPRDLREAEARLSARDMRNVASAPSPARALALVESALDREAEALEKTVQHVNERASQILPHNFSPAGPTVAAGVGPAGIGLDDNAGPLAHRLMASIFRIRDARYSIERIAESMNV
jgi:hypothetical protein